MAGFRLRWGEGRVVVGRCIVERDWVSHKALCQLRQSVVGKMEMSMNLKGVSGGRVIRMGIRQIRFP